MPMARERGKRSLWWASPEIFFLILALLCAFLMGFYAFHSLWHDLLLEKIILSHEKPNAGQNCFQIVTSFYFFLQHVSLTLFHLCPRSFW